MLVKKKFFISNTVKANTHLNAAHCGTSSDTFAHPGMHCVTAQNAFLKLRGALNR